MRLSSSKRSFGWCGSARESVQFGATFHPVPMSRGPDEAPLYLKLVTWRADLEDVPKHIDSTLEKRLLLRVGMFRYAEYGVLGTSSRTAESSAGPGQAQTSHNLYYVKCAFRDGIGQPDRPPRKRPFAVLHAARDRPSRPDPATPKTAHTRMASALRRLGSSRPSRFPLRSRFPRPHPATLRCRHRRPRLSSPDRHAGRAA